MLPPKGRLADLSCDMNCEGFDKLLDMPAILPTVPRAPNNFELVLPIVLLPEEDVFVPAPTSNNAILDSFIHYLVDKIKHIVYYLAIRNHL
jgi:hypothetical protein